MNDLILLGVLRMPMPENPDPMTLRQFVSRAQQAACRIEADADELEELRGKAARLAVLVRSQDSEIARLRHGLVELLPYMEMQGLRLANDYRARTSDATRKEGDALLEKVDMLRTSLEHAVNVLEAEGCAYTASQCREALNV